MRKIILSIVFFFPLQVMAEDSQVVATLFSLEGEATIIRAGSQNLEIAELGARFDRGDTIKLQKASRAGLQFKEGGFVRLGSQASLLFKGSQEVPTIEMASGDAYFFSRKPKRYPQIDTPTVSAAMRGTEFSVLVNGEETTVAVIEGSVELRNDFGQALLDRGDGARVARGETPTKQLLITLPDTVQWMAHVPFIGSWNDYRELAADDVEFAKILDTLDAGQREPLFISKAWVKTFAQAATLVRKHHYRLAFNLLNTDLEAPALKLLCARVALAVGEIDKGKILLDSQPPLASVSATKALLSLSKGDIAGAQSILHAHRSSDNFSVLVVQSLIAQANLDLDSANQFLTVAQKKYPHSPFLTIRKAELALASGELDTASGLIDQSLAESTDDYAQAIAGFIHLAKGERSAAEKSFKTAIQNPSSANLGLFGSALLHTVSGEQKRGIELFQQAVLLDPQNAMLRSYLGKAFSQATQEETAQIEYQQAMQLDPNDPTPWLYRSYSRIAQNRPVEALADIEESIARNGNRAIFRSSFLLDQDSAMRSASLARVFNELGFSDAGRIEAIKSISKQYSNFAAHRLLSETEDTIFLADASLSERRISDLMAPLSLNLFDSISGSVTLNEYSALFESDQTRFAFAGDYSSFDDLYAPSLLVANKHNQWGYAFSAGAISRDGSAHGNTNQDYRISSMVQYQPTWRDRLSVTTNGQYVRTRDSNAYEQGAELRRFGVDLGYLHTFAPGAVGIVNSSVQRSFDDGSQFGVEEEIFSTQIFTGIEDTLPADILADHSRDSFLTSVQNQAQFIFDGKWFSSVSGASISRLLSDRFDDPLVLEDSLGELSGKGVHLPSSQENSLSSYSLYSYQTAHLTDWIHLTAGLSYEEVERDLTEVAPFIDLSGKSHRLAPKFGLVSNPVSNLTLRSSYSEGLRKAVLEDQVTIEPTMVGGINQRFNDLSGTESRQFGLAVDWKIPQNTYAGIEWSRRHIIEPISFATNEFIVDFDNDDFYGVTQFDGTSQFHAEQDFVRAYLSQVLSEQFVVTFDNRYSKQRFTDRGSFERIEDNRSSATLKYFDRSGLILFSRALWRYQERVGTITAADGSEPFWHFDTGAGYRIMGRKGIIKLELRNLLNQSFDLDQTSGFEQTLPASRAVFLTARFNY